LLAGQGAVPAGITVGEIPGDGAVYEVQAGYRAGIRHEVDGRSGLAFSIAAFLALTPSGRRLTLAVYSAGGDISFFTELDRTGVRLKTPAWAKPMVDTALSEFVKEAPSADSPELVHALLAGREIAQARETNFRAQVDDQIRIALLGAGPYHHPSTGWSTDLAELSPSDVEAFFLRNYGTDRAFLLASSTPPPLANLAPRSSTGSDRSSSRPISAAQRVFRFPEQESGGAVVFASPVSSVFYRGWYAVVLLDQVIKATIPGYPFSTLVPALNPYYYRFEVSVPAGQTADAVQQVVMQELERMQFVRATDETMNQARSAALQYLESTPIRNWFTSLGIDERRQEGMQWAQAFTADDLRVAARELLLANRVVALWSPKPKEVRVETESIDGSGASRAAAVEPPKAPPPLAPITVSDFPPHPAHEDKTAQGPPATQNLPAALVFKALLDRRLIETGLWSRGSISLRPAEKQGFVIDGSAMVQAQIREWLIDIGNVSPAERDVEWARETAVHRLEAAPDESPGVLASQLQSVAPEHLQDVARIHLANQ
jgi:hypothetical protein